MPLNKEPKPNLIFDKTVWKNFKKQLRKECKYERTMNTIP